MYGCIKKKIYHKINLENALRLIQINISLSNKNRWGCDDYGLKYKKNDVKTIKI